MTVTLDELAIEELLHGLGGPVMTHVDLTAHAILDVAKELIHTTPDAHVDGSPHLRETGHVIPAPGVATVVFDAPYAAAVELGARPRIIRARNAKVLAFAWPKVGPGTFFFKSVSWPGFEGQHYLLKAAEVIAQAPLA